MKKVFLCLLVVLIISPAFSEEVSSPDYTYFFVIRNQRDEETALATIKTWIAKYSNYYCGIDSWVQTESDEGLGALAIKMTPGPIPGTEIALCQLYLKRSVINLILSANEIYGLTQKYTSSQVNSVYNRVNQLYRNNMR